MVPSSLVLILPSSSSSYWKRAGTFEVGLAVGHLSLKAIAFLGEGPVVAEEDDAQPLGLRVVAPVFTPWAGSSPNTVSVILVPARGRSLCAGSGGRTGSSGTAGQPERAARTGQGAMAYRVHSSSVNERARWLRARSTSWASGSWKMPVGPFGHPARAWAAAGAGWWLHPVAPDEPVSALEALVDAGLPKDSANSRNLEADTLPATSSGHR